MIVMASTKVEEGNPELIRLARDLGLRIRDARIRRRLRQQDLAARTGLSRSSIQSIERGDLSCSIAILFQVLWNMGLTKEVELLADPGLDRDGLSLAWSTEKKRVFVPRKLDNDF
jgi:transcriptional regulator with XRE-family HTH domain